MIPLYQPSPTKTQLGQAWAELLDPTAALVAFFTPRLNPALGPLLLAIYHWLFHSVCRLDRLVQRWQAGTLPKPRPSRAGEKRARKPPRPDRPRIRTGRLWLVRLVQRTAQFDMRLQLILARDDIRALVQAAPQAGRLIRPMCRAWDVPQPDWLRLPPRPRKPRPAPAPKPAKPKLPPGYLPGMDPALDRPLPANIIAAVRFYKKRGY